LTLRRIALGLIVWLVCQTTGPVHANQDAFSNVRELYLSADYEGTLAALDHLGDEARAKQTDVADYRVLCLLALDRSNEARKAITSIVETDPFHHLSEGQASPRMRAVFEETRKALLPDIVQRMYADAKTSFDNHDPAATHQFDRLLALVDDPDLKDAQLSDLRAVAVGFRDLSKSLRVPPAPPAPPPVEPPPPAPQPSAPAAPAVPVTRPPNRILTGPPDRFLVTSRGASLVITPKEPPPPGLEPPLAISQPFPQWSRRTGVPQTYRGLVELTIDEQGNITTVALQQPMQPAFDQALIKALRTWKYKPALLNGRPVPFLKVIEIQIQSEG
jgi:protein TonB